MTYPTLNLDLIDNLIKWAERDTANDIALQQWIEEHRLGVWDQAIWGVAEVTNEAKEIAGAVDQEVIDLDVYEGVCRTAHCMAGGAVAASGYRLVYEDDEPIVRMVGDVDLSVVTADKCQKGTWVKDGRGVNRFIPEHDYEDVQTVATELLGITELEASSFFFGGNTIADLKRYVNKFCDERGLVQHYPDYLEVEDDEEEDELESVF